MTDNSPRPFFSFVRILLIVVCIGFAATARAQDKPAPSNNAAPPTKFPAAKSLPNTSSAADAGSGGDPGSPADKDSPDAIRKRDEWFYKQRASVHGRIPAGARQKAFQHMQRMMAAEGKLEQRPDGSYAAVTPQVTTPAWTSIGPTPTTGGTFSPVTGRITTIAVDPSDTTGNTVLIGGAQGGVWRSTDAGTTWTAVGDQNASLAMGSIAFAPSQTATVYAGTGEQASIGFDIYYGAGVLKSTDHGQTWTQTCTKAGPTCPFIGPYLDGLNPSFGFFNFGGARISYIAVNPSNPDLVLAAAQLGIEGPTEGIYCSADGGATWVNLFPDEMATFVGFASPTVAYAAFGQPFGSSPFAPHGNGIYKGTFSSTSSCSATFTSVTTGLPAQSSMGRIEMGISPNFASDKTIYASIADASTASSANLGVWVTNNGGTSWNPTQAPDICQQQCWYDNVLKVDPNNKNIVYFGGSAVTDINGNPQWVMRTTNGGSSWSTVIPNQLGPGLPHVDTHALAFVKSSSTGKVRLYMGNDGGIWRTDDAEAATVQWTNLNDSTLTLTQFYPTISLHTSTPSVAFGGTQDNSSQQLATPPSWVVNTGTFQTPSGTLQAEVCGDGTSTAVDPNVPSTVYISCQFTSVNASYQTGAAGSFFPATNGIDPTQAAGFVPPLVADPNQPNVVYFGAEQIYQSVDAANSWTAISPFLGGNGNNLTALAIGAQNSSVIYAGTNDGLVFVATGFTNGNLTGFQNFLPTNSQARGVTAIAVDPSDTTGMTAYASFTGFSYVGTDALNPNVTISDPAGHIFKTTNGGQTWTDISCSSTTNCSQPTPTDLPNIPVNDVVVDPDVPNTIYAATDLGVYTTTCTATPCTWSTLGTGLPHVAVLSMRLHEASRTLRAATHGRGAWDLPLNNFTFSGPHISSLSPTSTNAAGASSVTLTVNGSGLTGGTVNFAGTALTTTAVQPDTLLTATIPTSALVAGSQKVTVTTSSATSNALPFEVLALTPTLASCTSSPSATSSASCGTPVQTTPSTSAVLTLTGTNFANSARTLFDGAGSGIASKTNSTTTVTATLPSSLLGPFGSTNDISVLNTPPGGGKSQPITFKIVAPAPPDDNFANAINITTLSYVDVEDSSNATTSLSDPTPPPSCVQQLTAAQGNTGGEPNGVYNTIWYQFTPTFPAVLEVDTIGSTYDTVLSIWTSSSGNLTNVACNDDINPGVNIQSQLSQIALAAGTTYYFMVSSFGPPDPNPIALGGKSVFNFSYNAGVYPAPTLTSISPTSSHSGDPDLTITVNGSGFFNGAGVDFINSATSLGSLLSTTFVSSTQLTAVIPASSMALPGNFNIEVNNPFPNSGPSNTLPFTVNLGTYPVPTLISVSPTTVVAGSFPFQMLAGGANFAPGAVLSFNGASKATTVNSPSNVSAMISAADISTAGTVQVVVTNPSPGGGPSAPLFFVITQPTVIPTISSLSPPAIPAGLLANLTVSGTGFTQGASLNIGGPAGNAYNQVFVSSTQLFAQNVVVDAVGTIPVYIIDPAPGGTSAAFNLTVTQPPPPNISSLTPSSAPSNSTAMVTIIGTNFQNGASVTFNNQTVPAAFEGTTQLVTNLNLSGLPPGNYPVVVVNPIPSAMSSNAVNFTVTPPPDFSFTVAAGQSTQTVTAGQTATFTNVITVNPMNGFNGQVSVSCTSPAQAASCSVSPLTLSAGQSASVQVTTTARGLAPPALRNRPTIPWPRLLPIVALAMLLCFLLARLARTRRQRLVAAVPLAGIVLFVVLQAIGCGGGSSTPPPPPPPTGTPAGNYMITVTGTSGNLSHTTTLTLVVN